MKKLTRYFNSDGLEIEECEALDRDGILKDHCSTRVPLMLRDGKTVNPALSPVQRAIASRTQDRSLLTDGHGDQSGNRPGYRLMRTDNRQAIHDALARYENEITNRYKVRDGERLCPDCSGVGFDADGVCDRCAGSGTIEDEATDSFDADTGAGSKPMIGAREGDICTVRGKEYPEHFGSPGHIRGGVCVPDALSAKKRDAMSIDQQAKDHQQRMSKVYDSYDRDLSQQWRKRE
jgi:hypothetical protein